MANRKRNKGAVRKKKKIAKNPAKRLMSKARKKKPSTTKPTRLSNPKSTGGAGVDFQARVQATFVILMLASGFAPCLPTWKIEKIQTQGKLKGYQTDDMILFATDEKTGAAARLLGQIKEDIPIIISRIEFGKVMKAAWDDFNNPKAFTQQTDQIALITGPLSSSDINDTRTILEWARHSEDEQTFLEKVATTYFSSGGKRNKLEVFRHHLAAANNGDPVTDKQLWEFLKRFHLFGYDLDIKAGVTMALLHSLIAQFSADDINALWLKVVEEVREANKNADSITVETISAEIREAFAVPGTTQMPQGLQTVPPVFLQTSPTQPGTMAFLVAAPLKEIVIAQLLGSWHEGSAEDKRIVELVAGTDYESFIAPLRVSLSLPNFPLEFRDGLWQVKNRLAAWDTYGSQVFDDYLDHLKNAALDVLGENDPKFELDPEKRYAASVYGKVGRFSNNLRRALAASMALLFNRSTVLTAATHGKPDNIARSIVAELLIGADWVRWASLKQVLPTLAEAGPDPFLRALQEALNATPCPLDELFAQETGGITGSSYIAGVLWGLETLAWEEQYLSRAAVILSDLAVRDKGGRWTNRPINSLSTIFLPWLPQTSASFDAQLAAIRAVIREQEDVAWDLLVQLLPSVRQSTTQTRRPDWRPFEPPPSTGVPPQEYRERVQRLTGLAVELAKSDSTRLGKLVSHLESLPQAALEELLAYLGSDQVRQLPNAERQYVVDQLLRLAEKHSKFADAPWAFPKALIDRVRALASALETVDKMLKYRRLFSNRDFEFVGPGDDYTTQLEKLEKTRQDALRDIIQDGGPTHALEFARKAPSPRQAGFSLGQISDKTTDGLVLPALLSVEEDQHLVAGYVIGRLVAGQWQWVDILPFDKWSSNDVIKFFTLLPFGPEAWERAERVLGTQEGEYWRNAPANAFQAQSGIDHAIDKLAQYDRPLAAVACVYRLLHQKQGFDGNKVCDILLKGAASTEPVGVGDDFQIVEVIKALQKTAGVDQAKLIGVEWLYLDLLEAHQQAAPKTLEFALASTPGLFMEILGFVYRPIDAPAKEPTESEKKRATNAYQLLRRWSVPPGLQTDGSFDASAMHAWLKETARLAGEAKLTDVALAKIGEVLSHAPVDPSGLWIHKSAAAVLDHRGAQGMRNGFRIALLNLRGAHWVDPEAKPEKALAEQYEQKAKAVEAEGFSRLGGTLRELAESYRLEASEIRRTHGYMDQVQSGQ